MITEPLTSQDHLEIRDVVRALADDRFTSEKVRAAVVSEPWFDAAAWDQMVELGWTALGIAEEAGGAGLGAFVQCIVHRELGARLAPTPYLSTAGFAAAALSLPGTAAAAALLEVLAAGDQRFAVVLGHGRGWAGTSPAAAVALETNAGWELNGAVDLVTDAAGADRLLVLAQLTGTERYGLFLLDPADAGVTVTPTRTVDATRLVGDVRLSAALGEALHGEPLTVTQVDGLVDRFAVSLAAEMVGSATAALRLTLDYLRTREQFGRPIGTFQALKHRCADMAVAVTVAQELVFSAAEIVDAGVSRALSVAAPLALARAGEVFRHVAEEGIQLHGGVGFTDEMDIGLYYKRALSDLEILATPVDAYARVEAVRGRTAA
ncbi:acyl-CoA dehydrogenase family protein [Microbispora sp. H10836]|uniref:acyl-CoA dehydrogenase family protein n=1 Tax=Microbispora sp. H10836 TaxID=2729106 RepID=UPI00147270F5|nr:acyl-CoA dehydrogenase family protein [Microbispora sp. H10836]